MPRRPGYNATMFRLTREVRFAINVPREGWDDKQFAHRPTNSHGGYPALTGFGYHLAARVGLIGPLQQDSQYLVNIKQIDEEIRGHLQGLSEMVRRNRGGPIDALFLLRDMCQERWREQFESISLLLSPFLEIAARRPELPMVRLSQKFEFSASHRLFNPALSDDENCRVFGKCSNPHGHGHNYELQVTLSGRPDQVKDVLVNPPDFERIVATRVIDRFDHKNLNVEVPEFAGLIPSVENISRVIYKLLQPHFGEAGAKLASVTVWETPKTWCEYSE